MKTNLLLLKSSLLKTSGVLKAAFLLLVLLGISTASRAQVVYSMGEPGNTTAATSGDLIKKMNYDGTNVSTVITGTNAGLIQPLNVALDGNNNRIFVSEGNLSGNVIKVITGSSVTGTITSANSAYIKDINYDVVGNWLYYITESGDITQATANDALYRVHPDGTGSQTLATSVTKNPYRLEVDAANNKVYVVDVSFSGRSIKTVDLANSNAVTSRAFATTLNSVYDVALDKVNGYLYYCAEGGSAATLSATDQVRRQNIDGTNDVQIAASVCNSPFRLGLDAGNNRLYVGDAYYGSGKIVAINLTNNTFSTTLSFATGQNFPQIYDFGVPEQPKVTTTAAASVTATGATLAGNLVYGYGMSTERGVVYSSTNTTPTVSDTKAANATVTTNGAYSASVSGLTPVTTYYARAYAINGAGTTYGAVVTFTTISNDANLSAFTISSGTLTPTFAAGTTSYSASVTNAATSITVTPTRNQANATIKVNTVAVNSGSASGNLSLAIGNNTITTVVTAQDASTKTYTLTVTRPKAAQTITFASTATKTYGNADFAPGASTNSGLTISYVSSNTAVATIVNGQIHIVGAGTSTITASQAGDANYLAASDATQLLTVNKASQTITFNALTAKTYGNANFAPGATVSSPLSVTYTSDNTAVATIVSNQVHIVGQGTANITASQGGNANYNAAANVVQSLTVNKANLTITAAAKTKNYGDTDPAFTYTATGVVGSDAPTGALSRVSPTTNIFIGTYAIDQGTLSYSNNYNVTYVGANLTINKRPITVLPIAKTKVYGDADPFLNQFQTVAGSLASGDATSDQFGRAAGENVGTYLMSLGTKKFVNGLNDVTANYDITVQPAYVTITAKPITVTATAKTKTYGDNDPALTYTANVALGFSDSFTGALSRAAGEGFGTYAINKNTLALSSNYTLTYVGANLTIGKKIVNVIAEAKTKTFGDSDPALTYTADELASGDSFSGALTRVAGENFGAYAISQGTLAVSNSSNYTLSFTGADLTINKKTINVTAAATSKTYGDTDPALTYAADALIGGDSFTGAISRAPGESFGTYAITQGTLALGSNYTLNYTSADLSIEKRVIDIYSGSRDVQYGDPDGTIGYSYSGTPVSGDTFSGSLGHEPGSALGTYATTIGTFGITNGGSYDLIFHSGAFNIVQREIIVSGGSTFKIYGDADPAINYSIVSGTLLGGTQITGALTRDAGETAGPYNVSLGTLAINDSNYKLTFQGGYFEIDRAPLTLTIDNKTKVATKPNPALTYSVTGYKNGDTEATAFTSAIQLTTDATISSAAGDYNIYVNGGAYASNYNVTTVGGTMTVTPASSINTLASATLNGGGFNEAFDPATDFYSASVPNGSTSATLIATVTDPLSTMSIGYDPATATPIASGAPYTVTFTGGNTQQVPVNVTAENGTVHSYYFNITPIPSDSKLSNLSSSVGVISPSFNPLVTSYTLDVSAETDSITITPTTHDPLATARVSGGGEGGATGAKRIAVHEGGNPVNITVRSADHTSNTFYQLYIKRPIRLKTLMLSAGNLFPAFDPNVTSYVAKVGESIPAITVTPEGNQSYFQITVNGDQVTSGDASAPVTINADGSTTIAVTITAGDGETSKTYNISVVHASSNAALAGISLSTGALDPVFDPATLTYNVYLPNTTTAVSFTPTVADATATMTINASPAASGATITNNNLTVGLHNYYLVVTAADGVTANTYNLRVSRAPSSESGLSNIVLSQGTLSPVFDIEVSSYTASVSNGVSILTLTPAFLDATGSLSAKVNGSNAAISSGVITAPLNSGANTIDIISTAEDGVTTKTYTITVTRALSNNAAVLLKVGGANLVSATGSGDENYKTSVANTATSIVLTPTALEAHAVIRVNGTVASSGSPLSIPLTGAVTQVTIQVTAEDGVTTRTATLQVNKTGSTNAWLTQVVLSPYVTLSSVSGSSDYNFSASVGANISSVTLTATPSDSKAIIRVNNVVVAGGAASGAIALSTGSNVISTVVTAEDGITTKTYTITVTRLSNNAAVLLKVGGANLVSATGSGDENYKTSVANTATSIVLTPTALEAHAVIRVNGTVASSGSPLSIPLTGAVTQVTIQVTAEDGVTTRTATLQINKTGSTNAWLTQVVLSPYVTLSSVSGSSDYNFSASVGANISSVTLTATPSDSKAIIRVNNVVVAGGAASGAIALSARTNVISTVVTAEDGITTKTYTITVTRLSNNAAVLLKVGGANLVSATGSGDENYKTSVANTATSIVLTPTALEAHAVIRVNGTVASSGSPLSIPLTGAVTQVTIQVTAEDGVTTRTATLQVNKTGSTNAWLTQVVLSPYVTLSSVSGSSDYNFSASVGANISSVTLTATPSDSKAIIRVNNVVVAGGAASGAIALSAGSNVISTVVTAEDGITTKTYTITVTRASPPVIAAITPNKNQIDVLQKTEVTPDALPELVVKQALSPNGDGVNDRFTIQGINAFPDNTVRIMNRNGDVIYEAKGYDNFGQSFDGHSSKGTLQQPGTYFYSLEYKNGAETKRKTGYLVIKY